MQAFDGKFDSIPQDAVHFVVLLCMAWIAATKGACAWESDHLRMR